MTEVSEEQVQSVSCVLQGFKNIYRHEVIYKKVSRVGQLARGLGGMGGRKSGVREGGLSRSSCF